MTRADEGTPLVSVVILAYNRRDALEVTLAKVLEDLEHPAGRLEVIVVDNASEDGTEEMVRSRFPSVELLRTERNEGVPAWNRGFEAARGEWLLVLDDDCYLEGDALCRALGHAARHGADLVSFRVESSEPGRAFTDAYPPGMLAFWGCSVLVSARALRAVGGFDPGIFLFNHELEFTMRFLDAGMRHLALPEVASVHMKPLPAWQEPTYVRNMRNFAYVAAKLLRPADATVAVGNLLIRSGLEALGQRRVPPSLPAVLAGLREGRRVRRPLRPAVSRLYRRNYVEYANPIRLARRAARRGPGGGDPAMHEPLRAFWEDRRELYLFDGATTLRVP